MAPRVARRDSGDARGVGLRVLARASRPYLLPLLAATLCGLLGLLMLQRVERYLARDERFVVRRSELGGRQSPGLSIGGISRASARQVEEVFFEDAGRSVFEIPLAERRERLKRIQWVKDASVSRLWPNGIFIGVSERTPEAFVQLPPRRRGEPVRPGLIDIDGVLLDVPEQFAAALPVLTGIREDQALGERAARVRLMQRLRRELGRAGEPVSEFDVRDPENVKIVYPFENRAVTLILGGEDWRARFDKFLRHYPEIRRKMPNAIELDLRLKERIIATELDKEADGE